MYRLEPDQAHQKKEKREKGGRKSNQISNQNTDGDI